MKGFVVKICFIERCLIYNTFTVKRKEKQNEGVRYTQRDETRDKLCPLKRDSNRVEIAKT